MCKPKSSKQHDAASPATATKAPQCEASQKKPVSTQNSSTTTSVQKQTSSQPSSTNDGLRDYIEHVFLALDDPDIGPAFISLLRSLGTHADSRQIFNLFIHNQILKLPGIRLPNGEVALEVNAVGAQIIGLIFFRYILEVPHVAAATPAELAAIVAPAIGTYLTVVAERREQSSAY